MTTALAVLGLVAYFGGAALLISWACRRTDVAFVRDMHRVLRSHAGGGSEAAGRSHPQGRSAVTAGVERAVPHAASAPPAPQSLAGAACPPASAASARPPRVAVHG